jgi:erythromycin esterase
VTHKLENFIKKDPDPLLEHIGDAKYVLLGEASHGTSEFYMWRAEITKRLVTEKGFSLFLEPLLGFIFLYTSTDYGKA